MVGVVRFELTTPCSQSRCANRAALHPDGCPTYSVNLSPQFYRCLAGSLGKISFAGGETYRPGCVDQETRAICPKTVADGALQIAALATNSWYEKR